MKASLFVSASVQLACTLASPVPALPVEAAVILPCWSTVISAFVYDPGVTAVWSSLSAVTASSAIFAVSTALSAMLTVSIGPPATPVARVAAISAST